MAFQPAVISASNGLMATPAVGASTAPSSGDAGLFQSMLAGATNEAPVAATPGAAPQAAPSSSALALLLQTQDAEPAQAVTPVTEEAAPATTLPAAFAPTPVDGASGKATAQTKPQTAPATQNIVAQAALQTDQTTAPVPAATPVEAQAVTDTPEQAAAAQPQPATTPDVAQAIIFAPFAAAQVMATPTATAAAPAKDGAATPIEADAPTQSGLFKKIVFGGQTKAEPANGAIAKIAGEALAAPQTQTAARADTAQPGAASPITGFDAPRPATESISTPVARALHGAAAMQVAQHVARRFDGQSANFEVRLDPAELGRVDVKITVDHDKRVTAAVFADSAQTLSDLRGAARDIERALNEAGLDLAQGGLSFDLNQRQANDETFDASAYAAADADDSGGAETVTIAARPFGMERWSASGVDVWA